ncbi:MAG: DegT/DnrJ/EryC1/StrS family aminotransferase [Caldilineaceae bacterium]
MQRDCDHVYHLYVVRASHRDQLRRQLQDAGISSAIHYPAAVHQQPAYQQGNLICHGLAQTERTVTEILTLPLYPQMTTAQVEQVVAAVQAACVQD